MRHFWDRRAREDAFYFVDNRLDYGNPDLDRFWAQGEEDLDALLGTLGVSVRPADTVVDVGCGVGRLTRPLSERAARVVALDVSAEMLRQARLQNTHLANVEWLLGDGSTLAGVAAASADACVSHVVFQHIPEQRVTLGYVREMGRVLKPGGWAAFGVSNDPDVHRSPGRRTAILRRLRAAIGRGPRGQCSAPWLGSAVDMPSLDRAARDGGMALERVVGEGTQFCLVLSRRLGTGD